MKELASYRVRLGITRYVVELDPAWQMDGFGWRRRRRKRRKNKREIRDVTFVNPFLLISIQVELYTIIRYYLMRKKKISVAFVFFFFPLIL